MCIYVYIHYIYIYYILDENGTCISNAVSVVLLNIIFKHNLKNC